MSAPNLDSSRQNSNNQNNQDPLDRWQYRIFRWVLFIIALYFMWKFLNDHVPIGKAIGKLLGAS